jgi:hypothetical protein
MWNRWCPSHLLQGENPDLSFFRAKKWQSLF